ncbi:hypothetical protein [Singulisphaera sp. GP187]|uniref:hypothetical protein n=1 Tax=Singulisphaera sp. GP187 TaxID=1882752 RepID=UPI0013563B71|nr:hypothetical protein [Singulisphaera sp. GP187]
MDIQPLPIRLADLLDVRKVESDRLNFIEAGVKAGVEAGETLSKTGCHFMAKND